MQKPLLTHDRAAAVAALRRMREQFPGHRLTTFAELAAGPLRRPPGQAARRATTRCSPRTRTRRRGCWRRRPYLRELNRMPERLALLEAEGARLDADPLVIAVAGAGVAAAPAAAGGSRVAVAAVGAQPPDRRGRLLSAGDAVVGATAASTDAAELYRFAVHARRPRGPVRGSVLPGSAGHGAGARGAAAVPAEGADAPRCPRPPRPARCSMPSWTATNRSRRSPRSTRRSRNFRKREDRKQEIEQADRRNQALGDLLLFRRGVPRGGRPADAAADADLAAARATVPPVVWHKAAGRVCPHQARLRHRRGPLPGGGEARSAVRRVTPHAHRRCSPRRTAAPRHAPTSRRRVSGSRTITRS